MLKLANISIIFLVLFSSCSFAQSMYDAGETKSAGPASASDFQNAIGQISKQTQKSMSDQGKQLLPSTSNSSSSNPPASQQTETPSSNTDSYSINSGNTSAQPGIIKQAPSNNAYSGFGTGNSTKKTTNAPASSGKSGGWNINY